MLDAFTAENAGVPAEYVEPGLGVIVTTGAVNAAVNGHPTIIAYAVVDRPGEQPDTWWVNVHGGGTVVLPQLYRRAEFLGIPAHGLLPVGCGCDDHRPTATA